MRAKPQQLRRSGMSFWLLAAAGALVLLLLIAPSAAAGGVGRLLGDLWVSTMGAVLGIFGALFGR